MMKRGRIYYCATAGCNVNTRTHPLERLFRFPRSSRNLERYLKWVEFAKNPRLRKDKPVEAYMCARHFTRNQFRTEYQMTLVYQAVPTIPPDQCPEESFSAKCKFKAPYFPTDEDEEVSLVPCDSSDALQEREYRPETGEDTREAECSWQEEEEEAKSLDLEFEEATHLQDHCYWYRADRSSPPPEDHTYYSNAQASPSSVPPSSPVLLSDLVPEEHPWFKITTPPLSNVDRLPEETPPPVEELEVTTSSPHEEEEEDVEFLPPSEDTSHVSDGTHHLTTVCSDPAKVHMSIGRYKAFILKERNLTKTLKKKERTLKRVTQRYREKCLKIKELNGSNAELTKLVEALTNSVSVCCDLLGIHDVVFKT